MSAMSLSALACSSSVITRGPPGGVFGGVFSGVVGSVCICSAAGCMLVSMLHAFPVGIVVHARSHAGASRSCVSLVCACVVVFAMLLPAGIRVSVAFASFRWFMLAVFLLCALSVECNGAAAVACFRFGDVWSVRIVSVASASCSAVGSIWFLYSDSRIHTRFLPCCCCICCRSFS